MICYSEQEWVFYLITDPYNGTVEVLVKIRGLNLVNQTFQKRRWSFSTKNKFSIILKIILKTLTCYTPCWYTLEELTVDIITHTFRTERNGSNLTIVQYVEWTVTRCENMVIFRKCQMDPMLTCFSIVMWAPLKRAILTRYKFRQTYGRRWWMINSQSQ